MTNIVIGAAALVITFVMTPVAIVAARHLDIVDRPGELKPQSAPVPYLGGLAVLTGLAIGVAIDRPIVLIPLVVATAIGVADDRLTISPLVRILGQFVVGVLIVLICHVHIEGVLGAVLLVVVTVLLINGVNLIDGLDMLASGVAAIAAIGFAVLLHGAGRNMAIALAAALFGFLLYNRPPARIYLGDGGSYLLGTALTVLLAASWSPSVPNERGVAALLFVAIPAAEVCFAVIRRFRGHLSVVEGDRGHPYDRLVAMGWARPAASGAYFGAEALLAGAAVAAGLWGSVRTAVLADVAGGVMLVAAATVTGGLSPRQDAPI